MQNEASGKLATALRRGMNADGLYERARKRCVGTLDGHAVYFAGSCIGFHLAIESTPGLFRKLSEEEHLRFKLQSRTAVH